MLKTNKTIPLNLNMIHIFFKGAIRVTNDQCVFVNKMNSSEILKGQASRHLRYKKDNEAKKS